MMVGQVRDRDQGFREMPFPERIHLMLPETLTRQGGGSLVLFERAIN